jgi:hypothetical protein
MKRKHLIQAAGDTTGLAFFGDGAGESMNEQTGFNMSLYKGGALSLFGIICLILCFLVGLAATGLLFFSLI